MPIFDIHVFLTNSFVQSPMQIGKDLTLTPWRGSGSMDFAKMAEEFAMSHLGQNTFPEHIMSAQLAGEQSFSSTVILSIGKVAASSPQEAFYKSFNTILSVKESVALLQYNRGTVAGFFSIQTDIDPYGLYMTSYAIPTRKVYQLLPTRADIAFGSLVEELQTENGFLSLYVSLYADSLPSSDNVRGILAREGQIAKLWTLLETMAIKQTGRNKQKKVESLYRARNVAIRENYEGFPDESILDIAYKLRNVVVHSGGCTSPAKPQDVQVCERYGVLRDEIVEDLTRDCASLIMSFVAMSQAERLGIEYADGFPGFLDSTRITFQGEGEAPIMETVPGTASLIWMDMYGGSRQDDNDDSERMTRSSTDEILRRLQSHLCLGVGI